MTLRKPRTKLIYRFFLGLLLFAPPAAALAACSSQQGHDQAVATEIQKRVSLAVNATQMNQTAIAERIRQTDAAEKVLTPLPTNTFIPTETFTTTPTETPTKANVGTIPENAIVYYLTLIGTGCLIGYGDSLITVVHWTLSRQ